jgi:ferric-dicitrate binding protein FerR (iron transport regulator)
MFRLLFYSSNICCVGLLNDVAQDFDLNRHASALPDIAEKGFSALNISGAAGAALEAWRGAGPRLHEAWTLFKRLATFEGHTIGPDRELSVNLFTVTTIGHRGTWRRAVAAADRLAAFAVGGDSVKPWQPLSPFIVTALHSFPLEFSTLEDAARIRRRIQTAA